MWSKTNRHIVLLHELFQIHEDHRAIGKYCGFLPPTSFTTESNVLYAHFVSDVIRSAKGFRATYKESQGMLIRL